MGQRSAADLPSGVKVVRPAGARYDFTAIHFLALEGRLLCRGPDRELLRCKTTASGT